MRTNIRHKQTLREFQVLILTMIFGWSCSSSESLDNDDLADLACSELNEPQSQTAILNNLVEQIDVIIENRDFSKWKKYLSDEYFLALAEPKVLKWLNHSPRLQNSGIKIENLGDYFKFVVVPSRKNVKPQNIEIKESNHALVYTILDNKKSILYEFQYTNEGWKLSFSSFTNGHFLLIR